MRKNGHRFGADAEAKDPMFDRQRGEPSMRRALSIIALLATLVVSAPAEAGMRVVYDDPGKTKQLRIEVADNGDARIADSASADYGLLVGGEFYVVSIEGGKPTVARLKDVAAAIDQGHLRRPAMVQPFLEDIRTRGEWSLIFIDGELTHAMLKHPATEDFRVHATYGGTSTRATPPLGVVEAGRRTLAALSVAPLYARVDGVDTRRGFVVMELEVHEPSLYFGPAPEAALVFADAIVRRL